MNSSRKAPDGAPGKVITFYSYKGGTGRSMAVANAAFLLAQREPRVRVLVLDWDLEAPGLHRYFRPYLRLDAAVEREAAFDELPGMIDFFEAFSAALAKETLPTGPDEDGRIRRLLEEVWIPRLTLSTVYDNLHFVKAGCFDARYSARVNRFNWLTLFERTPEAIASFAAFLASKYDFILIDSRTGHTDVGGVCTMLMPEKLVLVFTPNRQSIAGIVKTAEEAIAYRRSSSDLRALVVFPLVSRVETQVETLRSAWRYGSDSLDVSGFQPELEDCLGRAYGMFEDGADPAGRRRPISLDAYFEEVQIQQVPEYAYGERIAVMADKGRDRLSLARSYAAFVTRLVELDQPWKVLEEGEALQRRPLAEQLTHQLTLRRVLVVGSYALLVGLQFAFAAATVLALRSTSETQKALANAERSIHIGSTELSALRTEREQGEQRAQDRARLLELSERMARVGGELESALLDVRRGVEAKTGITDQQLRLAESALDNLRLQEQDLTREVHAFAAQAAANVSTLTSSTEDVPAIEATVIERLSRDLESLRVTERQLEEALAAGRALLPKQAPLPAPTQKRDEAVRLWGRGYNAFLAGNYKRARELYSSSRDTDETYAPPYSSLGRLAMSAGNYDEALGLYKDALALDPKYLPAYRSAMTNLVKLIEKSEPGSASRDRYLEDLESMLGKHGKEFPETTEGFVKYLVEIVGIKRRGKPK